MVEFGKDFKIRICPFGADAPEIDLSHFLENLHSGKSLELDILPNFFDKKIFKSAPKRKSAQAQPHVYICCFYLLVDGIKECNAVCLKDKKVTIFGESFIKRHISFCIKKENFVFCIGTEFANFVGKNADNVVYLCNFLKEDGDENVYKRGPKTKIFIYKDNTSTKIVLP